ncbi:hypothetical protein V3C99_014184 [Haemonchus contortus]
MSVKWNLPARVIDKKDSSPFEIDHTGFVSKHTASMFLSPDLSDVTFIVEEQEFPAHRFLLVAHSKYFRAMFLGGLKESNEDKVVLKETNSSAFHALLKYIYTGKLSMDGCESGHVMEILKVAHKYGFDELVKALAGYLKTILDSNNVCEILNFSRLYPLSDLTLGCISFTERNTQQVFASQGFLQLPANAVSLLLSPYRFHDCAMTVFRAVREWIMAHKDSKINTEQMVKSWVPLSRISRQDLLEEVRQSGLLTADSILDAIRKQENDMKKNNRRDEFERLELPVELALIRQKWKAPIPFRF